MTWLDFGGDRSRSHLGSNIRWQASTSTLRRRSPSSGYRDGKEIGCRHCRTGIKHTPFLHQLTNQETMRL